MFVSIRARLGLAFLLIASILLVGAAGFHYLEGWGWFDGLYMTVITMTTIGYGEIHPLSLPGRVFNIFLILTAVLAGSFLLATFTQAMLEFELTQFLGRRRMERELSKLRGHYIVCGAGRVGRTVAREFCAQDTPCVIVEIDAERARWAIEEKIPVVIGSGSAEDALRQARIEHAKGLVAAVTSDAENLYIVLTARGMRPDMKIIARASEEEATPKLLRAGASQVVSPYHFVGRRIAQLFMRPHVLDFIDTAFGTDRLDMQIEEVRVAENSALAGKSLASADIRQKTGAMVLALKQANAAMTFNPSPDSLIHPGDYLIAIGSADDLGKLEALAGAW
jgi:voltage-gated potassium channel